jgi:hypothetical protein
LEQKQQQDVAEFAKKQRYFHLLSKMRLGKPLAAAEIRELEKLNETSGSDKKTSRQVITAARQHFLLNVMNDEGADIEDRLDAARQLGSNE